MKPTNETLARTRELLARLLDYRTAEILTYDLAKEGLLNSVPADEHPEWIGVTRDIDVRADNTNHGSALLPIVLMNVRIDDQRLHFGLEPFVVQRLVRALNEALDDAATTGAARIDRAPVGVSSGSVSG